ncbi:MAG: GDP-fucose synthetase [Chloroflexi bacterium]|nr:GDP-fucose synthetase [Chloroflexota bacterium]|tara:strand:+ start:2082 stop:3014 length:933 start_codon:yes stop_codon:yes gene_type:complete
MNLKDKRILVTGGNGFLGRNLLKKLKQSGAREVSSPSSNEFDLRKQQDCQKIVKHIDIIFHLAGNSGGIGYMGKNPASVFYDNVMMDTQLLHEAKNENVEKFIGLGTVCSYPKFASIPFSEEEIWDGFPDESNAPYGISKKIMLTQSDAYRQQFGFNSITVIPTNIYGPGDNFHIETSGVIPGIISKIFNAIEKNSDEIELWGDGNATRDFLFVDDASDGIILAAEKYDNASPINLGAEYEISIKDLATMISKIMKFSGEIKWDNSKSNGQPRRCVSNKKAEKEIGFKPKTSLNDGLEQMIKWFELKKHN